MKFLLTTLPNCRLLLLTLGLTYIAIGMLGALPGASLIRLASNTHVSLEVAGSMFAVSAFGSLLGIVLSSFLRRYLQPKYLLLLGLFLLGSGSTTIVLTSSFPMLLLGQIVIGVGFGFIDPSLNTIATLTFQETLASELNTLHGLFGLGSLLGPLLLAFGLHFFQSLELSYFVSAGIAAFITILLFLQQIPEPSRHATNVEYSRAANRERWNVLKQGLLWLMVLQVSLFAAAEISFGNWIVTAVSQSAAVSLAQAAPVATSFFLGLMVGRFGGAQVLRRGWMNEASLLFAVLCGSILCGIIVALFASQILISYVASALVGCCSGPLEPGIMAMTSRRFKHAIDSVSSLLIISTNVTSMLVPAAMGLLIPALGINWVMAIPALCCAFAVLPMQLSNRAQASGANRLS
jgi:fucose permease